MGRGEDDQASAVTLHHQPGGGLQRQIGAADVDLQHLPELFPRHLDEAPAANYPGSIDTGIETRAMGRDTGEGRLDAGRFGQVAGKKGRLIRPFIEQSAGSRFRAGVI